MRLPGACADVHAAVREELLDLGAVAAFALPRLSGEACGEAFAIAGQTVHAEPADLAVELRIWTPPPRRRVPYLLARNATLTGARMTLRGDDRPAAIAELHACHAPKARERAREGLWAVLAAVEGLEGRAGVPVSAAGRSDGDVTETVEARAAVVEAGAALGCEIHERDGGGLALDLDVAGKFRQAELARGAALLRVVLDVPRDASRTQVRATALFLLRATGQLRFVRAACDDEALAGLRLEAELPKDARPEDAEHALRALTFAARWIGAEAELLAADARLATTYLEMLPLRDPNAEAHGGSTIAETLKRFGRRPLPLRPARRCQSSE
jgi:hypothetical protein